MWTKYWLAAEHELSVRGTVCNSPVRLSFPREALCPERALHVSHTEGLPPPCRASRGATWGLTPGFPFLSPTGVTAHAGWFGTAVACASA